MIEDNLQFADNVQFAEEELEQQEGNSHEDVWKVLIVDDEEGIHHLTKIVLHDFRFCGRYLQFHSAFTEEQAIEALNVHPDIALILLDVVMEDEDSGLGLVRYIREEMNNTLTRIILRTGQPGQAPESRVILDYDINDYKEKTELTSQKLHTSVAVALRSYRDLMLVENKKRGLESLIGSLTDLFESKSLRKFASGVLLQLGCLLHSVDHPTYEGVVATKRDEKIYVLAAMGTYNEEALSESLDAPHNHRILRRIDEAFKQQKNDFGNGYLSLYFCSKTGLETVIYWEDTPALTDWDRKLIDIYSTNVSIALENIYLNDEFERTQKEIIFTLGEITETRSRETGNHVKRVAEYSKLLALKYGLSEEEAELLRMASPMHDVGKVAIPDAILNKPGKLSKEEFEVIKLHATYGYTMLNHSNRSIFKAAAIIAHQHHEKYNGKGYPNGLSGEDIHIYARITAIADVFDALGSDRVYKKAWPIDEILAYFHKERGQHFDPKLVDLFFKHLPEILVIRDRYSDEKKIESIPTEVVGLER